MPIISHVLAWSAETLISCSILPIKSRFVRTSADEKTAWRKLRFGERSSPDFVVGRLPFEILIVFAAGSQFALPFVLGSIGFRDRPGSGCAVGRFNRAQFNGRRA